ncbi:hypothetical protein [Bacillus horti]|nr:hypothetical protein [Bacillus horti]
MILFLKMWIISYLLLVCFSQFVAPTTALHNDIETSLGTIQVQWEEDLKGLENAQLAFIDLGLKEVDDSIQIYAVIMNQSESVEMSESIPYELHWSEDGEPLEGVLVETESIPALGAGEQYTIIAIPAQTGNYGFNIPLSDEEMLWSGSIFVDLQPSIEKPSTGLPDNLDPAILEAYANGLLTDEDLLALSQGLVDTHQLLLFINGELTREELERIKAGEDPVEGSEPEEPGEEDKQETDEESDENKEEQNEESDEASDGQDDDSNEDENEQSDDQPVDEPNDHDAGNESSDTDEQEQEQNPVNDETEEQQDEKTVGETDTLDSPPSKEKEAE